jgi:hypothetical protein
MRAVAPAKHAGRRVGAGLTTPGGEKGVHAELAGAPASWPLDP